MDSLTNTNFLIIGGSSGIGLSLANQLSGNQASVYVISRRERPEYDSANINHHKFNITTDDFSTLEGILPDKLHGLAYCPGTINLKPFNHLKEDDFLNDFKINVLGAVKSIQFAIPFLKKGSPSSVVLFSTVATQVGLNYHASISASKSAVEGLAKSLASEYANSGIRFNVVAPSITQTPLAENFLNSEQKMKASVNRHPLKRIGKPEDMAAMAGFLLSPDSGWITGQVIGVDGGLSSLKTL